MAGKATIAEAYIQLIPTFDGVQGEIGKAFKQVDMDGAGREMGGRLTGGIGKAMAGLGGVLAGAFAAGKIKDVLVESINQASDLNEVATKTTQIFGDAAGGVEEFAKKGAKSLGQSNLAVKNAVSGFGVYGKAAGLAGADNVKFSSGLAQLATDMASFSNTSVEQATDALSAGLRGETEPLRAYGVLLDDASLRQEALAQGLITTTKEALTPQQKVLASQALIMKQTSDAQGDFERTSGGLANQQRILAASLEDTKGKLGAAFLPAVTTAVTVLNQTLFPALDATGKALGDFWSLMKTGDFTGQFGLEEDSPIIGGLLTFRDIVIDIAGAFKGQFSSAMSTLLPVLKEVGGTIGGALVQMFQTLWPAVKDLIGPVQTLLSAFNPMSLIFKVITPLLPTLANLFADVGTVLAQGIAKALQAVTPLFQKIADVINRLLPFITDLVAKLLPPLARLLEKVGPLLDSILGALLPLIEAIIDGLMPVIDALMPVVERVFTFIADTIGNLVTVFGGVIDLITGVLTGDWTKAWNGIKAIFEGLWNQIKNVIGTVIDVAVQVFTNLVPTIWNTLSQWMQFLNDKGTEFLGWLWQGIKDAAVAMFDWFWQLPTALWNTIVGAWQAAVSWGSQLVQWIWQGTDGNGGIVGMWANVIQWFKDLPGNLWAGISGIWTQVVQWGKDFITWIWKGTDGTGGIVGMWNTVIQWFKDLPANLWASMSSFWQKAVDWGSQLISWVKDGITTTATNIWNYFTGDINDPNSFLGGIWKAILTLKDKIIQIGKDFVGWIIEGVKAVAENIWKAITDAFTGQANSFAENPTQYMGMVAKGGLVGDNIVMLAGGGRWLDHPKGRIFGSGSDTSDTVPALVSPNEFVVRAAMARRYYTDLVAMNAGKYAEGGTIQFIPGLMDSFKATLTSAFEFGKNVTKKLADEAQKGAQQPIGATPNGAKVNSYDPSSFGWIRGGNINGGYTWNGIPFPGGVAGGTEGTWNQLLNELVPKIPGGIGGGGNWGYEMRNIAGSGNASFHSYGLALDINAPQNGRGLPGYGRAGNGVIPGEPAHAIAEKLGMEWGGDWSYTDPMHFEIHLPPSALGAVVGTTSGPGNTGIIGGLVQIIRKKLGLDTISPGGGGSSADAPAPVAGGKWDPNVERWRPTVLEALRLTGQAPGFADYVLNQIRSESSGDPRAINLWDSNARKGIPSKGLIQTIDPTFQHYRLDSLPNDVYHPLANIVAGIRYVLDRYGSIPKGMRGVAYDSGGWLFPWQKQMPMNLTGQPEPVLTPRQWDVAEAAISEVTRSVGRRVEMTVNQLPGQNAAELAREIDRRLAFAGGRSA